RTEALNRNACAVHPPPGITTTSRVHVQVQVLLFRVTDEGGVGAPEVALDLVERLDHSLAERDMRRQFDQQRRTHVDSDNVSRRRVDGVNPGRSCRVKLIDPFQRLLTRRLPESIVRLVREVLARLHRSLAVLVLARSQVLELALLRRLLGRDPRVVAAAAATRLRDKQHGADDSTDDDAHGQLSPGGHWYLTLIPASWEIGRAYPEFRGGIPPTNGCS